MVQSRVPAYPCATAQRFIGSDILRTIAVLLVAASGTLLLAEIMSRLIERPFMRWRPLQ